MKKILLMLLVIVALSACNDGGTKYPTVIRTGLWEVCQVNDSVLMAVPSGSRDGNPKPILFKLNDTETFNKIMEE